jgi:predicted lipoprotein
VTDALKNEAQRNQLDHFRLTTSTLSELIGVRLTGALGLSAGFSSLDGD